MDENVSREIPMSIFPCKDNTSHDYKSPNLGIIFPGQTLSVKLIALKWDMWLKQNKPPPTFVVRNTRIEEVNVVLCMLHSCHKHT